jgi:hypothetical protein
MKPEHKRMSRMLGYCLALGDAESWLDFSAVAASRLSIPERVAIAFSCLASLEEDQAEEVASAALGVAGAPLPPFMTPTEDARYWASCANRTELKAYVAAAFEALSIRDQAAFIQYINNREVPV